MKFKPVAVLVFLVSAAVHAAEPSPKLVDEAIEAMQLKGAYEVQLALTQEAFSKNTKTEERTRLFKYFDSIMGWAVIKSDLHAAISHIFTADELRAEVAFYKTPSGASIASKNKVFAEEMSKATFKRAQAVQAPGASAVSDKADDDADTIATVLRTNDVVEHDTGDGVYFTGALQNTGDRNARGVEVEVNLFQGGHFVDQYSTYISGVVAKGATRLFKINCGCKSSLPAKHDSFQVRVNVSGY